MTLRLLCNEFAVVYSHDGIVLHCIREFNISGKGTVMGGLSLRAKRSNLEELPDCAACPEQREGSRRVSEVVIVCFVTSCLATGLGPPRNDNLLPPIMSVPVQEASFPC